LGPKRPEFGAISDNFRLSPSISPEWKEIAYLKSENITTKDDSQKVRDRQMDRLTDAWATAKTREHFAVARENRTTLRWRAILPAFAK